MRTRFSLRKERERELREGEKEAVDGDEEWRKNQVDSTKEGKEKELGITSELFFPLSETLRTARFLSGLSFPSLSLLAEPGAPLALERRPRLSLAGRVEREKRARATSSFIVFDDIEREPRRERALL